MALKDELAQSRLERDRLVEALSNTSRLLLTTIPKLERSEAENSRLRRELEVAQEALDGFKLRDEILTESGDYYLMKGAENQS